MVGRLVRQFTRFETLSGRRVELWYDPTLASRSDLATHLERWEAALTAVEKVFGFALSRTVIILIFASNDDADRTFGGSAGGRALAWRTIAVGAEILDQTDSEETMRHELAHLFSNHWGRRRSPLKREGLAEWVKGTRDGVAIDACALGNLLCDEDGTKVQLHRLLDPDSWTVDRHRNYALAGSFTGFLIRRFGWEAYRRFFVRAGNRDFERGDSSRSSGCRFRTPTTNGEKIYCVGARTSSPASHGRSARHGLSGPTTERSLLAASKRSRQ
jgi:hypothetical protein